MLGSELLPNLSWVIRNRRIWKVTSQLNVPTSLTDYESIKRELKTRPIYECRYDERRKVKDEESTRLTYTGLLGELEHIKIEPRLIDESLRV